MRSPLSEGLFLELDEVASTQDVAFEFLRGLREGAVPGIVFAHHQTSGRGRLGREWISERGGSLTMSLVFLGYAGHEKPWLIGMSVAVAAAVALRANVSWPNDLILESKKLGGVLTELHPDAEGRSVPVVGVGINLSTLALPKELHKGATNLTTHRKGPFLAREVAQSILESLDALPEPEAWGALEPYWTARDATVGKKYKLQDGGVGVALGIGADGELVCKSPSGIRRAYAADALFSSP